MRRRIAENQQIVEEARQSIEVRDTVDAVQIAVGKLKEAVNGDAPVDKVKIMAAKALFDGARLLLAKVMPDQKAIEHTGSVTHEAGESIQEILIRAVDANRSTTQGG